MLQNELFNIHYRPNTGDEWVIAEICDQNCYLKDFIVQFAVPQEGIVIDIGAHIGCFTLQAAAKLNPTCIVAVEPQRSNFDYLLRNVAEAGIDAIVRPVQVALWNIAGERKLYLQGWNTGGHSLLLEKSDRENVGNGALEAEIVPATTLDDLLEQLRLTQREIMVLKIDAEGAEAHILEGAAETLRRTAVLVGELHEALVPKADLERLLEGFVVAFSPPVSDLGIRTFWAVRRNLLDAQANEQFLRQAYVSSLEDQIWRLELTIGELQQQVSAHAAHASELAHLRAWVVEKERVTDEMIAALEQALAAKDDQLNSLQQALVAREAEMAALLDSHDVEHQRASTYARSLQAAITAKDEQIESLLVALAAHEAQLTTLQQARDTEHRQASIYTRSLQAAITAKDEQIESLLAALAAREVELDDRAKYIASLREHLERVQTYASSLEAAHQQLAATST